MNTKVLIGFIVVLVIVLALPLVMQVARNDDASAPQARGPQPAPAAAPRREAQAPLLNASNLVGTSWSVKTPEIPVAVTITLQSGGQAVATVPPEMAAIARQFIGADVITGTWSVQGSQVVAKVMLPNNTITIACDIVGDRLFFEDTEIKRIS